MQLLLNTEGSIRLTMIYVMPQKVGKIVNDSEQLQL